MPQPIELKSARTYDSVEEISKLLREIQEKDGAARAARGTFIIDDSDEPTIAKGFPIASTLSAPPEITPEEIERGARGAGIAFRPEHLDRVLSYWASDERVDGDGDIIRQSWDFSRYEKNPVLCDSHAHWAPPIGKAVKWGVVQRSDQDYRGPALFIAGLFALPDEYAHGDTIFRLLKSGFLSGGSVGFRGKKVTRVEDPEERAALGLGQWGVVFEESLLLEFSPTTIGSNPGAHTSLAAAKKSGTLRAEDLPVARELYRLESVARRRSVDEWARADAGLVAVAKSLFPDRSWKRHADMAEPIVPKDTATVTVHVKAPEIDDLGADVKAIRAALDEGLPAILRRLDDLEEQNAGLREEIEAMKAGALIASEEPEPEPEIDPSFELPDDFGTKLDSLSTGLARFGAGK